MKRKKFAIVVILLCLLFLLVDAMFLGDWVEFIGLVLLTWVFLYLIIKTGVVYVAFPHAFSVTG